MMAGSLKRQKGHVLIPAIIMLMVVGTFAFSFLKMAGYSGIESQNDVLDKQIFWLAEEGLSKAASLMHTVSKPEVIEGFTRSIPSGGGLLQAEFQVEMDELSKNLSYVVESRVFSSKEPGKKLYQITARYKALSPKQFLFIEGTPGEAYYTSGDTIRGSVHTNTRLKITGEPVFISEILESGHANEINGFICRPFATCEPEIQGPKPVWGVPKFKFDHLSRQIRRAPNVITPPAGKDARIVFSGNSYTLWFRDKTPEGLLSNPVKRSVPQGDGIFVNGSVEVEGVLDGKLTIGASGDIIITDHLTYADSDPVTGRPAPGSGSVLGLIAEKNVEVRQVQTASTRSKGIKINASIIAMDKSFYVNNPYLQSRNNNNKTHGVMHLWGNIIQAERGVVGSYRIRDKLTRGFTKNWNYDSRFPSLDIPYYPPIRDEKGALRLARIHWQGNYVEI